MKVVEIVTTVQGETAHAGLPCTLVRLAGCDLRCSYCDTPEALTTRGSADLTVAEIVREVGRRGVDLVLLTGGEPLLQPETADLARDLRRAGHRVMVETSGAHPVRMLPPGVIRIVDLKTPGSGQSHRNLWENLEALGAGDAVKFVLTGEADYAWAVRVMRRYRLEARTQVLLGPAHGLLDPRLLVGWMLRDRLRARLNLQIHRYVWGPDARGV